MNDKLKSRKFIVWVTTTIFVVVSLILNFIVKDFSDITKIFAEGWSWISAIYIGGNVAQKFTKGEQTE